MLPPLALEGPKKSKAKGSKGSSSEDEAYNPDLTGDEEEAEDLMVGVKPKAKAKAKVGKGFIRGQTLKPIDERTVIGSAPPLPFNDLSNDSFLVKPRTADPVV
jgi:hypothetical protein